MNRLVEIKNCCECPNFSKWVGHDGLMGNGAKTYVKCILTKRNLINEYERHFIEGFPDDCPLPKTLKNDCND